MTLCGTSNGITNDFCPELNIDYNAGPRIRTTLLATTNSNRCNGVQITDPKATAMFHCGYRQS